MQRALAASLAEVLRTQATQLHGIYTVEVLSLGDLGGQHAYKTSAWAAQKPNLGIYQLTRYDGLQVRLILSDEYEDGNYYVAVYLENSYYPAAELHKVQPLDGGYALCWRYQPTKHDKKNGERRAIFERLNGDLVFTLPLPGPTQEDAVSFMEEVFYLVEIRQAAHTLIGDLEHRGGRREGKRRLRIHWLQERDSAVVREAKRLRIEADKLACEVCGFDFYERYGQRGEGYIEAHHKIPLSQVEGERETRVEDLALVCANCHRMLHRRPWCSVEALRDEMRRPLSPTL